MNYLHLIAALFLLNRPIRKTRPEYPDSLSSWNLGIPLSIRSLSACSGSLIWAGANQGMVGRSRDGGHHWKWFHIKNSDSLEFRLLYAIDSNKILIANSGTPARIWRTANGGQSWNLVFVDTDRSTFFDALLMISPREGFLVGDPRHGNLYLLHTRDGGIHWTFCSGKNFPHFYPGEAIFAASNSNLSYAGGLLRIVTGGSHSRLWTSSDLGRNWSVSSGILPNGSPSSGIFSVCFRDRKQGIVVGGDFRHPETRKGSGRYSRDGGLTWEKPRTLPGGYRSWVGLATGQVWVATGPNGTDLSRDGGLRWIRESALGFNVGSCVPGKDLIFLAGDNGQFGRIDLNKDPGP